MKILKNQTVLVPFDFSNPSNRSMDQVLIWSDESTVIHVVFVVEPSLSFISMDQAIPIPPAYDVETRDSALEKMKEQFAESKYQQLRIHCEIGDPGMEIVSMAESIQADVIVMPSHGRTGLSRLLLGSVAERVLRLAKCPVLILRGKSVEGDEGESGDPSVEDDR